MKNVDQLPAHVRQILKQIDGGGNWRVVTVGPCALLAPPKPLVATHVKKPFELPSELDTRLCDILVPESDDKSFQAVTDSTNIDFAFVDAKQSMLSPVAEFEQFIAKYRSLIVVCLL